MTVPQKDVKDKDKDEDKDTKTADFDKERQRVDQERANVERLKAERATLRDELSLARKEQAAQAAKIAELTSTIEAKKSVVEAFPDIDPEEATVDDVAKALQATKKIIADQAYQLAELRSKTESQTQRQVAEEQRRKQQEADDALLADVCSELEEEFGAGLRNEAIKLMEAENAEKGLPANAAKAVLRLRKCFRKASEHAESKSKSRSKETPAPVDSGGGGYRPSFGVPEIKEGSLDEVSLQYRKALSGG